MPDPHRDPILLVDAAPEQVLAAVLVRDAIDHARGRCAYGSAARTAEARAWLASERARLVWLPLLTPADMTPAGLQRAILERLDHA